MQTAGYVIFIVVGLQGILLATFLYTKGSFRYRILAFICFIIAIDSISHLEWMNSIIHLLNHGNLFALGPFLFVFYRSLKRDSWKGSIGYHLVPFVFLKMLLLVIEITGFIVSQGWALFMSFFMAAYNIFYNVLLIYFLHRDSASGKAEKRLLYISYIFLAGWLAALGARFFDLYNNPLGNFLWKGAYGIAGVLVYYLTLSFLQSPRVFGSSTYAYRANKDLEKSLISLLEDEKMYLDPHLKREDLASRLGISTHELSFILNKKLDVKFNDLVNSYRIKECLLKMTASELKTKTISSIGLECGFGSKATFQRAFKKHTNFSPSEYLKKSLK